MTDSNATKRLRKLLEERGVEYTVDDSVKGYLFTINVEPKKRVFIETWENGGMAIWSGSLTPEQAVAATLGAPTLTAEQVRTAIFNGSSYASYDGAMYYANGINMQAIADELNAELLKGGAK